MSKREINVWDILFWLGMIILILYILAKIFGIINTPEWINLIPLITLAFIISAFYQRVIGFMDKMYIRTDYLKNRTDQVSNKINEHDKRLFAIEKRQETFSKI